MNFQDPFLLEDNFSMQNNSDDSKFHNQQFMNKFQLNPFSFHQHDLSPNLKFQQFDDLHQIQTDISKPNSALEENHKQEISFSEEKLSELKQYSQFAQLFLTREFDNSNKFDEILKSSQEELSVQTQFSYPSPQSLTNETDDLPKSPSKNNQDKLKSTNVTRNFIIGIMTYISENQEEVLHWAKKNKLKLTNPKRFFTEFINTRKKNMYSIKHLKRLLSLKSSHGKIVRVFGFRFLRQESFQFFQQPKFKKKYSQIQFRKIIEKAFQAPCEFNQLII